MELTKAYSDQRKPLIVNVSANVTKYFLYYLENMFKINDEIRDLTLNKLSYVEEIIHNESYLMRVKERCVCEFFIISKRPNNPSGISYEINVGHSIHYSHLIILGFVKPSRFLRCLNLSSSQEPLQCFLFKKEF